MTDPISQAAPTNSQTWEQKRIEKLVGALRAALPIVAYVSTGRRYVDVEPYPDATARRVGAQIQDLLEEQK